MKSVECIEAGCSQGYFASRVSEAFTSQIFVQYLTEQAPGCSSNTSERHGKTTGMPSTILNSWQREDKGQADGWMKAAAVEERRGERM